MQPITIIGAGLAGWTTVREFRKLDTTTPVVVVTTDNGDFYAKPSLSNAFAQKRTPEQLVSTPAAKMAETLGVTLLAHTQATQIDTAAKTVQVLTNGVASTVPYSQLVLATGAQPIRAPVQGNATERIKVVNSLADFAAFYKALGAGAVANTVAGGAPSSATGIGVGMGAAKTVVLVGAGLIGCEFANDLLQAGHQVHIVDPSPRPLAALLPEAAGVALQNALHALGAHWHLGRTVQAVDSAAGATLAVTLSDGSLVPADAVLSAIGLRADTALAAAAGLACERGIVVDAYLQTSAQHVYALGDCAQYAVAGQRTLPYVMPIMNAARALAAGLAGQPTALAFPLMPVTIKTPARPIVVAAPHPATVGGWVADSEAQGAGAWRFVDVQGVQRGFVLTGTQTARRMELGKSTVL
jgi:rubredoxin-NAD+ reductase